MYIFCINIHIYVRSDFLTYQGVRRYKMAKDKVVLAYSGGLDTTVIIPWLQENYNYDVIAVCIDVGQGDDWEAIKARALKTGAAACYVVDAKQEYIEEYIWQALKANAV